MGYSSNRERLIEMLPYLGTLLSHQDTFWDTAKTSIDPTQFAYRLHEAFHIAKIYNEQFGELAALSKQVRIKVDGTRVTATFAKLDMPMPNKLGESYAYEPPAAHDTYVPSVYALKDIQALWAKRQSSSINLPMYVPDPDMLLLLYTWGDAQEPPVYLMPAPNALTLIEGTLDLFDVRWTPDELDLPLAPNQPPD